MHAVQLRETPGNFQQAKQNKRKKNNKVSKNRKELKAESQLLHVIYTTHP